MQWQGERRGEKVKTDSYDSKPHTHVDYLNAQFICMTLCIIGNVSINAKLRCVLVLSVSESVVSIDICMLEDWCGVVNNDKTTVFFK